MQVLALQFPEIIGNGEVRGYAGLARLGCVSRERISQIMMLVWLAPDIQQAVLRLPPHSGCAPFREMALRKIAEIVRWDEQRPEWQRLTCGPEPRRRSRLNRTHLQPPDGNPRKQRRESAVRLGPRQMDYAHAMTGAMAARRFGMQDGLVRAGIQTPSLALWLMIVQSIRLTALHAACYCSAAYILE